VIELRLYQHTDTDDVDLGHCFVDALPPLGALIVMPTGGLGTVWKVNTVLVYPAMPGSMAARGLGDRVSGYALFVEPAEGPFHADSPAAHTEEQG
jgi:hypothetical protein